MRSRFPVSLAFFAVTALVFLLQLIPVTGVFLMFALAMFWSVVLVNAEIIGVAIKSVLGCVSRWWLLDRLDRCILYSRLTDGLRQSFALSWIRSRTVRVTLARPKLLGYSRDP